MSSESVHQVARSWVDVGSFHKRLFGVVYFAIASVREFLDTTSYTIYCYLVHPDNGQTPMTILRKLSLNYFIL
jgi:hypothetical protein